MFAVLIPDNVSPIIASADPINPTFTVGWLDYVQARGFAADPTRVRSPKDKPRVKRATPSPALAASVDADLRALLRKVKLGRILDTHPERITLARAEQLPHADFLTLVLSDEVDRRDRASAELRARTAKLDLSMRLRTGWGAVGGGAADLGGAEVADPEDAAALVADAAVTARWRSGTRSEWSDA